MIAAREIGRVGQPSGDLPRMQGWQVSMTRLTLRLTAIGFPQSVRLSIPGQFLGKGDDS